ncbi:MAG: D-alanyl-D-alanine carboxypeptidase/D-alanyl-D-alanine-endopeptidase [Bacteroidetes bacterium]|nr:D-alanyl-D-alanine carboxypeptidase/D-alanyl-D-alanine-endopeptidase [Bacteroidota bacterium]
MNYKWFLIPCFSYIISCALPYRDQPTNYFTDSYQSEIDSLLSLPLFNRTQASLKVVSITHNRILYERNSALFVHPASTIKLLVAIAAYTAFPDTFKFLTRIFIDSLEIGNATVSTLYLKGYGNPSLMSQQIDSLAQQISYFGIKSVSTGIVVDDSYFDSLYWCDGWMIDDLGTNDAPFISPLSVNKNIVHILVIPNYMPALPAITLLTPPFHRIGIDNRVLTSESTSENISVHWKSYPEGMTIVLHGTIPLSSSLVIKRLSIQHPEILFADLLQQALTKRGIQCPSYIAKGTIPSSAFSIAEVSTPIDTVVINMMKNSDNLSAECILKTIAAEYYGVPGSTRNGIRYCYNVLNNLGIDSTQIQMVDGSGISRYNLITGNALLDLLTAIYRNPPLLKKIFYTLPIAGIDGTLSSRLQSTTAHGRVYAKTGTLNGVSNLAGYIYTVDGELLAFAIMMQHFTGDVAQYRAIQDSIVTKLTLSKRSK